MVYSIYWSLNLKSVEGENVNHFLFGMDHL